MSISSLKHLCIFQLLSIPHKVHSHFKTVSSIQGLDLVEVSPPYDPAGVTTTLAARLVLDAMGFAMKSKPQPSVEL